MANHNHPLHLNPNPDENIIYLNLPEVQPDQPSSLVDLVIADRPLNVGAVIRILTRAWSEFGEVHVESIRDQSTLAIIPLIFKVATASSTGVPGRLCVMLCVPTPGLLTLGL